MASLFKKHFVETQEQLDKIKDKYCYLVGANGVFLKKENPIFKIIQECSITKEEKLFVDGLLEIEPKAVIKVTNFDKEFEDSLLGFFRWSSKENDSEVMVYLYYSHTKKTKWLAIPPTQVVSSASVDYGEQPETPKDYIVAGTAHSHVDLAAHHSTTDHKDQSDLDGIHITIGKVNDKVPDVNARLYVRGEHYDIANEDIMYQYAEEELSFPEEWKTKVMKKVVKTKTVVKSYPRAAAGFQDYYGDDWYWHQYTKNQQKKINGSGGDSKTTTAVRINNFIITANNPNIKVYQVFVENGQVKIRLNIDKVTVSPISEVVSYSITRKNWNTQSDKDNRKWLTNRVKDAKSTASGVAFDPQAAAEAYLCDE